MIRFIPAKLPPVSAQKSPYIRRRTQHKTILLNPTFFTKGFCLIFSNFLPPIFYFAGVDWGYEHPGAIVVLGRDDKGDTYLLEEHSKQYEEIEYWINVAKEIKKRYGNIGFYCDTARPEYIKRFKKENIKAINGDKSRLAGIGEVARLIKLEKFKVVYDKVDLFKKEIFMYSWNKATGEPLKVWDDVLDAIRYAIYTESIKKTIGVGSKSKLGIR